MADLPKFTLGINKMQSAAAGRAAGHNCRLHKTNSQLPKEAWLTPEGRHEIVPWQPTVLKRARLLSKRKDAVVAISFVFQVGEQGYWRHPPIEKAKEGLPKLRGKAILAEIDKVAQGAKEWAIREFGEENVVGIDLHTDESSPHVHVVVTPVHDGALQAKYWLDGASRCSQLRKRAWGPVNARIPCTYIAGAAGGAPHDERLAAGKSKQLARRLAAIEVREADLQADEAMRLLGDLEMDERMADLDARELAIKTDRADLEKREQELAANTPAALKERLNASRQQNLAFKEVIRGMVAALPEASLQTLASTMPTEQRQIMRAVMEAQGKGRSPS